MIDYVIVGVSGFAKEIKGLIDRINRIESKYNFIGFIDKDVEHQMVIGDDDFLLKYNNPLDVIIAIANPDIRHKLVSLYLKNDMLFFPNVIDPSVIIMENLKLGEGNIICAGSIITVDVAVGNYNIINLDCTVGHEVQVGNFVTINPGVNVSGNVIIDDYVSIGTGSQLLQGKRIGSNSIIGAGAVVTSDIPLKCTAVGVPAKIIKDWR